MRWFERVSAGLDSYHVSRAAVGRELGMTGQAITLKLQGERPTNVDELIVMARMAHLTVAEALGDDAVVIELRDEQDLITLYRLLTPEQQAMMVQMLQNLVKANQGAG